MPLPGRRCDLFCRVVDNFGDAGVCWRLARQLAREHGWQVRLIIDDAVPLRALAGPVDAPSGLAVGAGSVQVVPWRDTVRADPSVEVVIEAFACALPSAYEASLAAAARAKPAVWLNLEYLSAETWTTALHGCASPHPRLPLSKTFFFPGFDVGSGGLLVEADLGARFAAVDADRAGTWRALGLAGAPPQADSRLVSLFAYENPSLPSLLDAWRHAGAPTVLLVPESRASAGVAAALGQPLAAGAVARRDALTVHALPFLRQDDYDRLLRLADLNFVRGEDSFVRAQLAGRPFCWQIYPQDDGAHLPKLDAFLQRYTAGLDEAVASAIIACFESWNRPEQAARAGLAWRNADAHLPGWRRHAAQWAERLGGQAGLAAKLVEFTEERL
ncbi:elongation factor P maturation arginine rhamnosyltransferase EarP [Chitinasiproducens palmae]|uniref:Protein-arginine rhamnosyltransferase n=1 Tax=Chitinasiproducens palmae TaxID=1770053 RepID=A0A1H2PUT9_9BURK|nr:elongation factor P maturation arginine rhamnosyltransferase EarP [Chitinasiproducens palmae]SDV51001.1 conserved hypothetical protein, PP_1857 family [Chitinasiproducens palmae]